jgi:hypothetical protein
MRALARVRTPDKFRLAYPRIKPNPQRYQFSEEPEIFLCCSTLGGANFQYLYCAITQPCKHKVITQPINTNIAQSRNICRQGRGYCIFNTTQPKTKTLRNHATLQPQSNHATYQHKHCAITQHLPPGPGLLYFQYQFTEWYFLKDTNLRIGI